MQEETDDLVRHLKLDAQRQKDYLTYYDFRQIFAAAEKVSAVRCCSCCRPPPKQMLPAIELCDLSFAYSCLLNTCHLSCQGSAEGWAGLSAHIKRKLSPKREWLEGTMRAADTAGGGED
eukprot:SAG22_NODE_577_length_8975_cov_12.406827_6_plen_119_part_00